MDAVSFAYASAAQTQMQLEMLALRQNAEGQSLMADLLAQQVRVVGATQPATVNPAHLGGNVDTYA